MMPTWVLVISALDGTGAAVILRFADGAYIDVDGNFFEPRLLQPALVNVSPNDGGTFSFFKSGSVGEIELANNDGGLDYLVGYAFDGRGTQLWFVDNWAGTLVFTGTIERMGERGGLLFFTLKALTEALTANHPMAVYAGSNSPPNGLEGLPETIEGNAKPKAFGDCRNVSPVNVNDSLLIYEASSRADAVITAVYDDGVRLVNYLVNGARSVGSTSIAIDNGIGAVPAGAKVMFDGHRTIYTVATGLAAGVIVLASGLTVAISDNVSMEVVNSYTGSGTAAGQLQASVSSSAWSSYNGYFRLAATPSKLVTCDVMSVTAGVLHKAGDVFAAVAAELSVTIDSASVTELNSAGVIGLYIANNTPTQELFNAVARSVGGFYHYIGTTLYLNLLQAPLGTAVFAVEEWQVIAIEREATGLGGNGLPIHGVAIKYDRIETVQSSVAGSVPKNRVEVLKKASRETETLDAPTLARHPLAEKLSIDSLLRTKTDAVAVANRLLALGKVRRDVVSVTAHFTQVPAFAIGDTVLIKHARLGYGAGRYLVIVGYELDIKKKRVVLRLVG